MIVTLVQRHRHVFLGVFLFLVTVRRSNFIVDLLHLSRQLQISLPFPLLLYLLFSFYFNLVHFRKLVDLYIFDFLQLRVRYIPW